MDLRDDCPGCGGPSLVMGWTHCGVPVMDTFRYTSVTAAQAVPRGDIVLSMCHDCGLVSNRAFSPWTIEYGPEYEETQQYSEGYAKFEDGLVDFILGSCYLRNKRVIDIGCGKGEFLLRLCRRGANRGLGIDPALIPERIPVAVRDHLQLEQRFYIPGESLPSADLVCLKMTLEHIPEPLHFLSGLRRSLIGCGCPLFLQVPNGQAVLRKGAFWDVYYEHCNYFSSKTLKSLLRRSGFAVEKIWTVFGDHYICALAHPVAGLRTEGEPASDTGAALADFMAFSELAHAGTTHWRELLESCVEESRPVLIWGGGSKAVAFFSSVDPVAIVAAIDINPFKQGGFLAGSGLPISGPEILHGMHAPLVIVMNPNYTEEVGTQVARIAPCGLLQALA